MRQPRSPGWRTHLMFVGFDGEVHDGGDHLVALTPANPGYYWGNCLIFDRAATEGDFPRWMQLFDSRIRSRKRSCGTSALPTFFVRSASGFLPPDFCVTGPRPPRRRVGRLARR